MTPDTLSLSLLALFFVFIAILCGLAAREDHKAHQDQIDGEWM